MMRVYWQFMSTCVCEFVIILAIYEYVCVEKEDDENNRGNKFTPFLSVVEVFPKDANKIVHRHRMLTKTECLREKKHKKYIKHFSNMYILTI
jgi:hypothetical protein